MKTCQKLCSLLLVLCLVVTLAPVPARAAEQPIDLRAAVANAPSEGVVDLGGGEGLVKSTTFDGVTDTSDPWVITKPVTIKNGTLVCQAGGIVLGADVTLENVTLDFMSPVRSGFFANGHILTLKNVTRQGNSWDASLFCGGVTGLTVDARTDEASKNALANPGSAGKILIQGSTTLDNIYAGSISAGDEKNAFEGSAEVVIDSTATGKVGHIYSSGALQTYVSDNWFDIVAGDTKIDPPTPSPSWFPVRGGVTIRLYSNVASQVDGATGWDANAQVTFSDGDNNEVAPSLTNLSSLTVESGVVHPKVLTGAGMDLSVNAGATLRLVNTPSLPAVRDFAGGGTLVLGEGQTLTIGGAVSGKTQGMVGLDGPQGYSAAIRDGFTYLVTQSTVADDAFALVETTSGAEKFIRKDGNWIAIAGEDIPIIIQDFTPAASVICQAPSSEGIIIPLPCIYVDNGAAPLLLSFVPHQITFGQSKLTEENESFFYSFEKNGQAYKLEFTISDDMESGVDILSLRTLQINDPNSSDYDFTNPPVPTFPGSYSITITVPKENTQSGEPITRTIALTVLDASDGTTKVVVPVPEAVTDLVYNGYKQVGVAVDENFYTVTGVTAATDADSYTAQVTPKDGYVWDDQSATPKDISWTIAQADGPAAPEGVTAQAPTAEDGLGMLLGTTLEMEYDTKTDFSNPAPCGDFETPLAPGDYYVRFKLAEGYANYTVHYATVTVPDYVPPEDPNPPEQPSETPSETPSEQPSEQPSETPSEQPSEQPSETPSEQPSEQPSETPSEQPSEQPSETPSSPTPTPTPSPSPSPSSKPGGGGGTGGTGGGNGGGNSGGGGTGGGGGGVQKTPAGEATLPPAASEPVTLKTDAAQAVLSPKTAQALAAQGVHKVALAAKTEDNGDLRLTLTADGKEATGLSGVTAQVPVSDAAPGTVAVLVGPDGTETVVKKSVVQDGEMVLPITGSALVRFRDNSREFADMDGHWASGAVDFVSARELFTGVRDNIFDPNASLDRAMLVTVLYRLEDTPEAAKGAFSDVAGGQWYSEAVDWASQSGLVTGDGAGRFRPSDAISREQVVTILYRYAQSLGLDVSCDASLDAFPDGGSASSWAQTALAWAVDRGILQGDGQGRLRPASGASRAEAATLLTRFITQLY